ncbi:ABC transporter substrate-binding protein [Aquibium sp. A9E412]|uniref:heme/hemin ABC transporter substrate-binding protein n=1 Tax=Aquibium sp. A9E412 TaxID=2976767 RepID=UPI0025AFBC8D|nr:ABC transporter substrate-binding protein [Aquibium sp. A9E412]MDN2566940.1 ABC transporter substrate-binding protein [Aquibium sp. A9E412]
MTMTQTVRHALRRLCAAVAGAALATGLALAPAAAEEPAVPFADPSRLVTIGGALTEIVYALGRQELLVARDTTSTFPEAAATLPDVGYMRALSPEGVLSVDPTAILALEGSGPPETVAVLEQARVPLRLVAERYDRAGILDKIRIVGAAIGAEDAAAALAGEVGRALDAARAMTTGLDERRSVLFVLSLQGGKVLAAGSGTAADGMIRLAGAQNAITGFAGYKPLTDEAVVTAAPDAILMMARGDGEGVTRDAVLAHPALAATPAAAAGRILRMDGLYLLGFGPRSGAAAAELAARLYGDALAAPADGGAATR